MLDPELTAVRRPFDAAFQRMCELTDRDELRDELARIHQVNPASVRDLPRVDALSQVTGLYQAFAEPRPALEIGLRWLAEHRPVPAADALVHGDFRTGNLMVGEDGLHGVLDWELAHRGDPRQDLGWLCTKAWRFGSASPVGGLGTRADLMAGYAAGGGTPPDEETQRCRDTLSLHHQTEELSMRFIAPLAIAATAIGLTVAVTTPAHAIGFGYYWNLVGYGSYPNAWNGGPYVNSYNGQTGNDDFNLINPSNHSNGYGLQFEGGGTWNGWCIGDAHNDPNNYETSMEQCPGTLNPGWGVNFSLHTCTLVGGGSGYALHDNHANAWLGPTGTTNGDPYELNSAVEYCFKAIPVG